MPIAGYLDAGDYESNGVKGEYVGTRAQQIPIEIVGGSKVFIVDGLDGLGTSSIAAC